MLPGGFLGSQVVSGAFWRSLGFFVWRAVFLGKNMFFSASVALGVAKYGEVDRVHVAFGCFYLLK